MGYQYDQYLIKHKAAVLQGFDWMLKNLPGEIDLTSDANYEYAIGFAHDASKSSEEEYDAYDAYFYGNNKSYAVVQNFNRAWLHHIHNNPHHWQHWILINDDPNQGEIILDMPEVYIIEMICDWWSFSWRLDKLDEIFPWYEERKNYIKLSPSTRLRIEHLLGKMKSILEQV